MIRRFINRLRRQEPSQKHGTVFTPNRGVGAPGNGHTGMARMPRPNVKARRRAANKRARVARRANRG
jgi:hypothetical protein